MSRILFTVNYSIDSENLQQYNEIIRRLTAINKERGFEYFVFGSKNNVFTELSIFENEDAFDAADELPEDSPAIEYLSRINSIAHNITYTTQYEVTF